MESWPFKVVADKDGKPMVVVEQNGKETRLHPEEVSSMVLRT